MTILNIIHEEIFISSTMVNTGIDSGLDTKHYANATSLHFDLVSQTPGKENTRYTCVI